MHKKRLQTYSVTTQRLQLGGCQQSFFWVANTVEKYCWIQPGLFTNWSQINYLWHWTMIEGVITSIDVLNLTLIKK